MTDNEIIKALECCIDCKCKECPCYKNIEGEMRCTEIDEEEILDLIKRQKAEIERLNKEQKLTIDSIRKLAVETIESAKSEAIKEFAERFKKEIFCMTHINGNIYSDSVFRVVDNLVKEMTEE